MTVNPLAVMGSFLIGIALLLAWGVPGAEKNAKEAPVATKDLARSPGNTAYYVDAKSGDDANPGTAPEKAWKSIARTNETAFAPGDKLLFAGGQTFKGTLNFTKASNGTKEKPVAVSSFGQGRAVIAGGAGRGLVLTDCAHVAVKELSFVGRGRKNGSDGTGGRDLFGNCLTGGTKPCGGARGPGGVR
jgi:hypothetical protein